MAPEEAAHNLIIMWKMQVPGVGHGNMVSHYNQLIRDIWKYVLPLCILCILLPFQNPVPT